MKKGFTLAELLVVIGVVAVMGLILTEVFSRSLRGGNKSQIIAGIKQNGQAALELMDKTIRASDQVVCPVLAQTGSAADDVIAVVEDRNYTRFRFISATLTANAHIVVDYPIPVVSPPEPEELFLLNICSNSDHASSARVPITDTNVKSGASVTSANFPSPNIFKRDKKAGYKDVLTVSFNLGPGQDAPSAIAGQIDPVTFTTTVELR